MPFKGLEKTICNGKFVEQAKTLSSDVELRIAPTGLIRFNETSNPWSFILMPFFFVNSLDYV